MLERAVMEVATLRGALERMQREKDARLWEAAHEVELRRVRAAAAEELADERRARLDDSQRHAGELAALRTELYFARIATPPPLAEDARVGAPPRALAASEQGRKRLRASLHPDKLPESVAAHAKDVRDALGL